MKLPVFLGSIASIVTILAYFNIDANSSEPSFNNNGNNNYQINASGNVVISKDAYRTQESIRPFNCGSNEMVIIKPNTFGSINVDSYRFMEEAIRRNDQRSIEQLKYDGLVTEIKLPIKACIIQRAFHWYRVKVKMQGNDIPYWIDDRKYSRLD